MGCSCVVLFVVGVVFVVERARARLRATCWVRLLIANAGDEKEFVRNFRFVEDRSLETFLT